MEVALAYDRRTSLVTSLTTAALDFAANLHRPPVSFRGRVKEPVLLRQLLGALHRVILGDFRWMDDEAWQFTLDPVITVHPDQLFFEAFSNDESVYGRLSAPLDAFEAEGEVQFGTTNIDFTWELQNALQALRSSRRTMFTVGAGGFGVATATGAGVREHFERKVDVPEGWLEGFLQVQGALAMHPFVFDVRPVDLLSAIAFFQDNKPPRPPHGMRYEFQPNEPISLVLEPWDERFVLKGTHYTGYARTVRLWGRRRLELLQGVLPYAQRVTVGVLGRGLPHFYICHCGQYQFVLALSGWTKNDWSKGSAFDLLVPRTQPDAELTATVYLCLVRLFAAPQAQVIAETGLPAAEVEQALFQLCRAGRAMYDPASGQYRLRELFAEPLNVDALFTADARLETAQQLLDDGRVALQSVQEPGSDGSGRRETRAVAVVDDGTAYQVTVAVDMDGRLRFGRCHCPFFDTNLMSRGPCEHILATRLALDRRLREASEADIMAGRGSPS